MPNSFGKRARTRQMFARNFREHGMIKLSTYMKTYKVGDYVDVKANSACQKGMPYRFYHGKTGVIFNVSPRSVGVIIMKQVRGNFMEKRINVRIEHVIPSKCQEDFLLRTRNNTLAIQAAKADNVKLGSMKRTPALPREAHFISSANDAILMTPIPYETLI